ncbi:MAG TPA: ABC transporter permease [Vicinamibacterales bacterium]
MQLSRSLAVANAEFQALTRTKFFIFGVLLLPVMIGVSVLFANYAERRVDTDLHRIAIVDETNRLTSAIVEAAAAPEPKTADPADPEATPAEQDAVKKPASLEIVPIAIEGRPLDDIRVQLSDDVRAKRLYGFVDIPADVLTSDPSAAVRMDYYTENTSNQDVPRWLNKVINTEITRDRFAAAHVDMSLTDRLSKTTRLTTRALVERDVNGQVRHAREVHSWETLAIPFGLMYLMFISVMMSAPHMMTAVIEEKTSRISEVLLASVTPAELLTGKLIGIAGVTTLLALLYLATAIYWAFASGEWALVQLSLVPWFLVFLLCAVLMFGSIFLSIGAACSDLKDAQSMVQPAMFFMVIPLFMTTIVLRAPNSAVSIVCSLLPTWAPFLMLLRLASTPPPPLWQVLLSVVLTATAAAFFVWVAGRIFRVGLLMQGKPPNLPELLKWIRA